MLDLPVGTAKTRIRDGLIRLRDTMGVGVMSDIHALSGAYAVDALDDIERAQFERHLAECAELPRRGRSRSARPPALLAETTAIAPPAALRDRVLADIADGPPAAAGRRRPPSRARPRRRRRVVAFLVAAAAAVAIGTGAVVWQQLDDDARSSRRRRRCSQADDAETVHPDVPRRRHGDRRPLQGAQQGRARHRGHAGRRPTGKVYELWLQHDDVDGARPGSCPRAPDNEVLLRATPRPPTAPGSPSSPRARTTTEPERRRRRPVRRSRPSA